MKVVVVLLKITVSLPTTVAPLGTSWPHSLINGPPGVYATSVKDDAGPAVKGSLEIGSPELELMTWMNIISPTTAEL